MQSDYLIFPPPPDIKIIQSNFFRVDEPWNHKDCSSPFWYFWRDQAPGAWVECAGKRIELIPERILLIPPHTLFSTHTAAAPFYQLYLHFTASDLHVRREAIVIEPQDDPRRFFDAFLSRPASGRELRLYSILFSALNKIPADFFLKPGEEALDERILQVLTRINAALALPLSNRRLASEAGMSENNFLRLFKREMALSPQQYRLRRRIEICRDWLMRSDFPIEEIARMGGFADRYHFSKAFKKITGKNPGEYRRKIVGRNAAPTL